MSRPVRFRIRPERRYRWYYSVLVFGSIHDMQDHLRQQGERPDPRLCGYARRYDVFRLKSQRWYQRSEIGEVLLTVNSGSRTVAHEMTHAGLFYLHRKRPVTFGRKKTGAVKGLDERLPTIVGNMVAAYWVRWYKARDAGRIRRRK